MNGSLSETEPIIRLCEAHPQPKRLGFVFISIASCLVSTSHAYLPCCSLWWTPEAPAALTHVLYKEWLRLKYCSLQQGQPCHAAIDLWKTRLYAPIVLLLSSSHGPRLLVLKFHSHLEGKLNKGSVSSGAGSANRYNRYSAQQQIRIMNFTYLPQTFSTVLAWCDHMHIGTCMITRISLCPAPTKTMAYESLIHENLLCSFE